MITTRLDAVLSFSYMSLTRAEIDDALDAIQGVRWADLNDAETHDRVARAIWHHATNGAPFWQRFSRQAHRRE